MRFDNWFEKIDAIFGGHVWIDLPAGLISVEEAATHGRLAVKLQSA